MASNPTPPHVVEDLFGYLKLFSDGSIFRSPELKHRNPYIHDDPSVAFKDLIFDANHNLHLRLFKPQKNPSFPADKLPIVIYFHAGGFCFGSRTYPSAHNTCVSISAGVQAVVVSVDYRLAPENRLPAALDDGRTALKWLRSQAVPTTATESNNREEWLIDGVNFDRVFVFGDSSGGNMAHHLGVELGPGSPELSPVRIRGYMLLSPFFGGVERTKFEEEKPCEEFWTQEIYERFWRLAVPIGANADHPMANPFGPASPCLESMSLDPILVLVGGDEILRDRAQDYARRLKNIKFVAFEGKQHGFFSNKPYTEEAKDVIRVIHDFISHFL